MLMIPQTLMLEMKTHVYASQRKIEICGLLAGKSNVAIGIYPISNSLHSAVRFNMEPMELLAALMDMETNGWEIVAIYHTHPNGPDHPSETDVNEAYIPDIVHIIWSNTGDAWQWKTYSIDPPRFRETPVIVFGGQMR
jgi:proteasome lid subunit RPN8/RPN11